MAINYQKLILERLTEIRDLLKPEVRGVATESQKSFQALLDASQRTQYTDKQVLASVESCAPQEIEFFTLGKYISENDLEKEYASRGLGAVHPYALALYANGHQEEMDEKKYVGTHWKDASGNWCYLAFGQWDDRERGVRVNRGGGAWDDRWWFAGVRK